MYKALIFDLDDTLLDFRASETHSLSILHREMLDGLVDFAAFTDVFRKVNKVLWRDLEKALVTPQDITYLRFLRSFDAFSLKINHHDAATRYEEILGQSAIWFGGVQDAFIRLQNTHKIGLITNGISRIQRSRMKLAGISDIAHSIVVSEEIGVAKPNRRIFEKALEELGLGAKDCLMVGDTLTSDYAGASGVGMDFCWVNPNGATLPAAFSAPKMEISSVSALNLHF